MNKLQGYGVGKVKQASIETPEGGKQFLGVFVEFSPRTLGNGKTYTQRVAVRSYQKDMGELVHKLRPGTMITFVGEVDAYTSERDGKTYANPRLVGRIELLETGAQEAVAKKAPDVDGSDIPF